LLNASSLHHRCYKFHHPHKQQQNSTLHNVLCATSKYNSISQLDWPGASALSLLLYIADGLLDEVA
jgi:hypothetical protein